MTVDRYSLNGKVALVTGAARGIGLAIVEEFVRAGALVYAADINDSLADANLSKLADPVRYVHLDVSCEADWQKVSEQLDRHHGGVDVLVNNAGITGFYECKGPHDPEHMNMASWRKVHAVNLDGVALGCKYAIGLMKGRAGASIVNISSRSGLVGIPAAAAYASSKAGVRNHTKTVALYCAEQGYSIRCNSIHPGPC